MAGRIRKHVDVEIISYIGTVLAKASMRYFRGSQKARVLRFYVEVPVTVSQARKVLFTHHAPAKENLYRQS